MSVGVLFPGQGSQQVGMGADLFDRHPDLLGEEADAILGWSLREVCLEGPEERLTRTEFAQPALFAVSYARWLDVAPILADRVDAGAGHSLGEYTALTAAGMIDFEPALRVVAERGAAMAAAADTEPSGMAALIGSSAEHAGEVTAERQSHGGRLSIANLNAPGQVVVAGDLDDLEWLEANARELEIRRVIRLNVAGAFHSEFMSDATVRLEAALEQLEVRDGTFAVYSNVTAHRFATTEVKRLLERQVVAPVRFQASLEMMAADGVNTFVHIGPGDVTAGMARRTVDGVRTVVVNDGESARSLPSMLDE